MVDIEAVVVERAVVWGREVEITGVVVGIGEEVISKVVENFVGLLVVERMDVVAGVVVTLDVVVVIYFDDDEGVVVVLVVGTDVESGSAVMDVVRICVDFGIYVDEIGFVMTAGWLVVVSTNVDGVLYVKDVVVAIHAAIAEVLDWNSVFVNTVTGKVAEEADVERASEEDVTGTVGDNVVVVVKKFPFADKEEVDVVADDVVDVDDEVVVASDVDIVSVDRTEINSDEI